jgi:hypothetical protein
LYRCGFSSDRVRGSVRVVVHIPEELLVRVNKALSGRPGGVRHEHRGLLIHHHAAVKSHVRILDGVGPVVWRDLRTTPPDVSTKITKIELGEVRELTESTESGP